MFAYIKDEQLKFVSDVELQLPEGYTVIEYEGDDNVIYQDGQIIPKPNEEPIE